MQKHFGITEAVSVGVISNMFEITEGRLRHNKTYSDRLIMSIYLNNAATTWPKPVCPRCHL